MPLYIPAVTGSTGGMANPMTNSGDMLFMNPAGSEVVGSIAGPFNLPSAGGAVTVRVVPNIITDLIPGHTYTLSWEVNSPGDNAASVLILTYLTDGSVSQQSVGIGTVTSHIYSVFSGSVTLGAGETWISIGSGMWGGSTNHRNITVTDDSITLSDRLPIGTAGQILTVVDGIPAWVTP